MKKTKIGLIILTFLAAVILGLTQLDGSIFAKAFLKEAPVGNLRGEYVQDEIIVKFKGDNRPFRVIKVPKGRVAEKLREHLKRKDVEYAEPNFIAHALLVPNDDYYSYQWHLDNSEYGGIEMERAWDISSGSGITIAIIDTGIAYEDYCEGRGWRKICYEQAPDLAETCFVSGYDFVNEDTHPNDDSSPGHGTHVAGTVAQSTNNNLGVGGVAFDSCLMPVKVLDKNGSGTYADVAEGIRFAVDHGAKVINLSLGGSEPSITLEEAVAYAYNHGVTVVAAAGNDGASVFNYPAAYDDYVIAVGATRYDETLAYYSSYGSSLDLVAPGGDLNVDQNEDGYGDGVLQQTYEKSGRRKISWGYYFMQGTSMATPHVSGVAALLIANGNANGPDEVRAALEETAKDLGKPGRDDTYGYGLVNAYAALNWMAGPACFTDEDCDDGLYCNGTEVCFNGVCKEGTSIDCSGLDDQCNQGVCDEDTDECVAEPRAEGTECDDGLFCTENDYCSNGICMSGLQKRCDDGQECTNDSCDEENDVCLNEPVEDNTECSEGICCGGVCNSPSCSNDTDCEDNNACTIDACVNQGTCSASCSYTDITECADDDGCCPTGCENANDNDCSVLTTECGNGQCEGNGEDCHTCSKDCREGKGWLKYCCGDGVCAWIERYICPIDCQ